MTLLNTFISDKQIILIFIISVIVFVAIMAVLINYMNNINKLLKSNLELTQTHIDLTKNLNKSSETIMLMINSLTLK